MSAAPDLASMTTPDADAVAEAYAALRAGYEADPYPSWETRRKWLQAVHDLIVARREDIARAISADWGHRSWHESMVADVWIPLEDIRHLIKNVKGWMKPTRVNIPYYFLPASGRSWPLPKGVVGVIAPWNYPFQLCVMPACGALAAGNRVLVKPSEMTPRTSALVKEILETALPPDVCRVVEGGVDASSKVAELPLDHLFFTGSPRVGRMVMGACAKNLTPVTLELGGKCPLVVSEGFDVERAATAAMLGKLFNAGQTCLAVDTVLVHEKDAAALTEAIRRKFAQHYPAPLKNPDYSALVSPKHKARLEALLADAKARGATVIEVNPENEDFSGSPKLAPHIVVNCPPEADLMNEEIFGPILPIVTYPHRDSWRAWLRHHPDPLALYLMDDDSSRVHEFVTQARSGGMIVNDVLFHFACTEMPFGGIRSSGIGAAHGKESFDAFTHYKSVAYQTRLNGIPLFHPPYTGLVNRALAFFIGGN